MPPRQQFEYHPEAILEAIAAREWYSERSLEAAEGFWKALSNARNLVTRHPQLWGSYFHGTRCLKLRRYPYGLVYIERDDKIVGVAVAHFKRKPGYWRNRITEQ